MAQLFVKTGTDADRAAVDLMFLTFMLGAPCSPESCASQTGKTNEVGACFSPPTPVFVSALGILMPPLGANTILNVNPLGPSYVFMNAFPPWAMLACLFMKIVE
eukprot:8910721-Pyramimonas_sp.AAC.1